MIPCLYASVNLGNGDVSASLFFIRNHFYHFCMRFYKLNVLGMEKISQNTVNIYFAIIFVQFCLNIVEVTKRWQNLKGKR